MRHVGLRSPPFSRAPPSHGVWLLVVGEEAEGVENGETICWVCDVFGIRC